MSEVKNYMLNSDASYIMLLLCCEVIAIVSHVSRTSREVQSFPTLMLT